MDFIGGKCTRMDINTVKVVTTGEGTQEITVKVEVLKDLVPFNFFRWVDAELSDHRKTYIF